MGKNIGLIFCLLAGLNLYAQDNTLSYKKIDSTTYAFFINENWRSLIDLGKESKKEGVDFYYLKVRMGIAYFKEGKMLSAIKYLEEAYRLNTFDLVVQDYLYWAYRSGGMLLESDLFYKKMDKELAATISNKLHFISALDVSVVATENVDYEAMLVENQVSNSETFRFFPKDYQLFMLGLNHRFSRSTNFYHRLTIMPTSLVIQQNSNGTIKNSSFEGTETRYYADATFGLGKRFYLDAYLGLFFGNFDEIDFANENPVNSDINSKYTDVVFGASISRACFYFRQSVNISYGNLGEFDQFQAGYTLSLYPLGNLLLVPFGSFQYQNETSTLTNETHLVYTGGVSINTEKVSVIGYINSGEMHNFLSNNGSVIYNQSAMGLNEYGAILQFYINKATLKLGYSFMNMQDYYYTEDLVSSTYTFNQQNLIGGFTWKF